MPRDRWPAPTDFDAEAQREWKSKRSILAARGELTTEDDACLIALERLCRARQLLREARKERAGKLTAKGSTGQIVAHPLIAVETKAEADIASAMNDLLMTPKSRKSGDRDDPGGAGGGGKIPRGAFG